MHIYVLNISRALLIEYWVVFSFRLNYNGRMKKLFILLLLSLGFTGLANANHDLTQELHHMDYAGQSDTTICSWFDVLPIPEGVEAEAEKRGLNCGRATNKGRATNETNKSSFNCPANSQKVGTSTSYFCTCKSGYFKNNGKCVEKSQMIPENDSHIERSTFL